MQQYAGIYLLQNHSTCFGCPSHTSSGVHKTVTAASGTGHSIWATTFLRGNATLEDAQNREYEKKIHSLFIYFSSFFSFKVRL